MNAARREELESFRNLWQGGYYEGDPLKPLSRSGYGQFGYLSVLHAVYLCCIRPYIRPDTVALEIGPGRGAWTKCLLPAKQVWVMDALSAAHNRFFEYLGHPENVNYVQMQDFSCSEIPDNTFSYMFSFGCLCHVSPEGVEEYARNLFPKMKSGANCFWMIGDYSLRNRTVENAKEFSIWPAVRNLLLPGKKSLLIGLVLDYTMRRELSYTHNQQIMPADDDLLPRPGRWYNLGTDNAKCVLSNAGFRVVDPNVGACLRDPIIHFVKA